MLWKNRTLKVHLCKCISITLLHLVSSGLPLESHKTITQVSDGMSFGCRFHNTGLDDEMLVRIWHHHALKNGLHKRNVKTAIPHAKCKWPIITSTQQILSGHVVRRNQTLKAWPLFKQKAGAKVINVSDVRLQ